MPKQVTGYWTNPADGEVSEHQMYVGDLNEACTKFPKEWSKSPKGAAGKAHAAHPTKKAKPVSNKKAKPVSSPTPPAPAQDA